MAHILLVEDDADVQAVVSEYLGTIRGPAYRSRVN